MYAGMLKFSSGLLLVVGLFSACGSSPKEAAVSEIPVQQIRLAGRIQRVNDSSGFVLIRRYGGWHVGENEIVESRGEGRTANLLPSGERLGEHIAADVRSGEVEVGDAVYIRKLLISKDSELSEKVKESTEIKN